MRLFAKIVLIILIIPVFVLGLLTATFKFQILTPNFWENTFQKQNTYQSLSNVFKNSLQSQVIKEGGRATDVSVLTDLVTPENVKDFVNKNIENILNFAGGKIQNLTIYIPITKIPKNLLPVSLSSIPENMSFSNLLTKFNIQGIDQNQIQNISRAGQTSDTLFILDISLFLLFTILLFILENHGSRLVAPGISFILDGLIAMFFYTGGNSAKTAIANTFTSKPTLAEVLVGVVVPPILSEILVLWLVIGVVFVVCGIVLLFIKKP